MTAPNFGHAKDRAAVTVTRPGRPTVTGRLLAIPGPNQRRKMGRTAKVRLSSGAVISVPPQSLALVEVAS